MNMDKNIVEVGKQMTSNILYLILAEIKHLDNDCDILCDSEYHVVQPGYMSVIFDSWCSMNALEITNELKRYLLDELVTELIEGEYISCGEDDFMGYMNKFEKVFEAYKMKDSWIYDIFHEAISIAMQKTIESDLG